MDRSKKDKNIFSEAAEIFDLPADAVVGLPHIEMVGNGHFYMEHHRGILSYSGEEIDINGDKMIVRVFGEGLELVSMTGEALRIYGTIRRVEWVS
ncbi:MAG: sporulation protein [Oscillospiraceae bacterium]|nr:sporulation protein [Oscillospiraceae bacterium]